jgi:L-ascorbate metabolism protein UlaG (beta-lactamase superfamily)
MFGPKIAVIGPDGVSCASAPALCEEVVMSRKRIFIFSAAILSSIMLWPQLGPGSDDRGVRPSALGQTPVIQAPPAGGAFIWYLGHCGYAVRTRNHFLIFDYQEERDGPRPKTRPALPSLAEGWIVPDEIKDLKVRVFVSHSHSDHFSPIVYSWKKEIPDIAYYFGWQAGADPSVHYFVLPRTELISDGLEISTINSHHSGVFESAFLVKVDGLIIYHNGDCQPADAAKENDFLRTKTDRIDLAFVFPVSSEGEKYGIQNRDFFGKFKVAAAFPMHVTAGSPTYLEFQNAFQALFPGLAVHVPMKMGETFVFENGRVHTR